MDNILACYKDGTNGTRNCRYFGVVYHIALFIFINSYMLAESTFLIGIIAFILYTDRYVSGTDSTIQI